MTTEMLILGLPAAGKSTFLAALYYCLSRPESKDRYTYQLKQLPNDSKYVDELIDSWSNCRSLVRTSLSTQEQIDMTLLSQEGSTIHASVPDLSGELYEREILQERKWSSSFAEKISNANAFLLFVNPMKVVDSNRVDDNHAVVVNVIGTAGTGIGTQAADSAVALEEETLFSNIPTQVKLVDLIQLLKANSNEPIKLAVVISAWDTVENLFPRGEVYLERRLPLLDQFLKSNTDSIVSRVYALSAQGGDFVADLERLQEISPSDRIKVKIGDEETSDLTALLRWFHE